MESTTLATEAGVATRDRARFRVGSLLIAVALVVVALVLVQQRADAAPAAQIDVAALIRSIVCPILNQLAAAFANFFGGIVTPIINALQAAFGCGGISGG